MSRRSVAGGGDDGRIATELENCVLGIVAEHQPCTAYRIRHNLKISLSSYWSASAGAIYPLMQRLEDRGWIRVDEEKWGSRTRRSYSLTRAGRHQLRAWLSPPLADWAAAFTYDPVRTRIFFLGNLSPKRRLAFLDEAIARTETTLGEHRDEKKAQSATLQAFDSIGRDGAIAELEARARWLRSVRKKLD
ncbi:MAG: PadR family transcriptional regulator [Acidobacteriota bacterium]|nr:PadR family transcriptional regulator [Acidobacteriota bacterium]MDH3785178.1 PadR family transcriptional regulator [Acidobacteriota bacterium]